MAVNRLGILGRLSGIWLDVATRSQNQGMLAPPPPGAIRMILLHGEPCNFTTLPNMADGGKVYAFRSYHGRVSTSTAVARGSGTGDTNRGNLLLNLVANKSILGRCHLLHRFVYLGFYVAFNTVQVISRRVVGRAEETST